MRYSLDLVCVNKNCQVSIDLIRNVSFSDYAEKESSSAG